jgi:hypothetical protein
MQINAAIGSRKAAGTSPAERNLANSRSKLVERRSFFGRLAAWHMSVLHGPRTHAGLLPRQGEVEGI